MVTLANPHGRLQVPIGQIFLGNNRRLTVADGTDATAEAETTTIKCILRAVFAAAVALCNQKLAAWLVFSNRLQQALVLQSPALVHQPPRVPNVMDLYTGLIRPGFCSTVSRRRWPPTPSGPGPTTSNSSVTLRAYAKLEHMLNNDVTKHIICAEIWWAHALPVMRRTCL